MFWKLTTMRNLMNSQWRGLHGKKADPQLQLSFQLTICPSTPPCMWMSDLKNEWIFTSYLKLPQLRQAIPTSPAQIEDSWATQIIGLLSHWVGMVSNAAVNKWSKSPIMFCTTVMNKTMRTQQCNYELVFAFK